MDRPYVPISCGVHDQLLALATLRQECALTIGSGGGRAATVREIIVDVYSRSGAEYLELSDGQRFRLDEILALDGRPVPPP
jgi:Rho-binding antiterminator